MTEEQSKTEAPREEVGEVAVDEKQKARQELRRERKHRLQKPKKEKEPAVTPTAGASETQPKEEGPKEKAPEFRGLRFYLEGFTLKRKKEISSMIVSRGGSTLASFVQSRTTHVVVPEERWPASGDRRAGTVPVVPESWVAECVKQEKLLETPVAPRADILAEIEAADAAAAATAAAELLAAEEAKKKAVDVSAAAGGGGAGGLRVSSIRKSVRGVNTLKTTPPSALIARVVPAEAPPDRQEGFRSFATLEAAMMPTLDELCYGDLKIRDLIDDPRASMPKRIELMSITALEKYSAFSFEELRFSFFCDTGADVTTFADSGEPEVEEEEDDDIEEEPEPAPEPEPEPKKEGEPVGPVEEETPKEGTEETKGEEEKPKEETEQDEKKEPEPEHIPEPKPIPIPKPEPEPEPEQEMALIPPPAPAADEVGKLWSWGNGASGQLGNGKAAHSRIPSPVAGGVSVVSVACGSAHTLLLDESGRVFSFGKSRYGQLGNGQSRDAIVPTLVNDLEGIRCTMIACGSAHSLALSDAALYSWGRGDSGQLGHGPGLTLVRKPMKVGGTLSRRIVFVAAGGKSTIALSRLGHMAVWGANTGGQLAVPRQRSMKRQLGTTIWAPLFLRAPAMFNFVSIGECHAAALTPDGRVFTWGTNLFGCLGLGDIRGDINGIRQIRSFVGPDGALVDAPPCNLVSCGKSHTALITKTGRLFVFGDPEHSKSGLMEQTAVPTPLDLMDNGSRVQFKHVSCGAYHTLATSIEGTVWAWGGEGFHSVPALERTSETGAIPPVEKSPDADSMFGGKKKLAASAAGASKSAAAAASSGKAIVLFHGPRVIRWLTGAAMATTGPTSSHSFILVAEPYFLSQLAKEGNTGVLSAMRDAGKIDLSRYASMPPPLDFSPLHGAALVGSVAALSFFGREYVAARESGDEARAKAFDLNVSDTGGDTALHVCAARGYDRCVAILVDAGANMDAQNGEGNTPLHLAAAGGYSATVEVLLSKRADRTITNEAGSTALHMAMAGGCFDSAKILVSNASAIDALDKDGKTPLDLCKAKSIVESLRTIGQHREVFISYAHVDIDFAKRFKSEIEKSGLRCWMDQNILGVGSDWRSDIGHGILQATLLVYVISSASAVSDWCIKELYLARKQGLPVIPVFYENVSLLREVSALIYGVDPIDFTKEDQFDASIAALVARTKRFLAEISSCGAPPPQPMPRELKLTDLLAAGESAKYVFISTPHDPRHPSEQLITDIGILRTNLLRCGLQSCADTSDLSKFEGPFLVKQWAGCRDRLLSNSAWVIVLLTASSLGNAAQLKEIVAARKSKKIAVAFSGTSADFLEPRIPRRAAASSAIAEASSSEQQQQEGGQESVASETEPNPPSGEEKPKKAEDEGEQTKEQEPAGKDDAEKKELIELLRPCPLFHLDREEGMRQLVYTIHMWERNQEQADKLATVADELAKEAEKLAAVDRQVAEIRFFYSFISTKPMP